MLDIDDRVRQILLDNQVDEKVALVGIRGYNAALGTNKTGNDLNVFDDLICIATPTEILTFVANTDPTRDVEGRAMLVPGKWRFELGDHNRNDPAKKYPAFIQAAGFTVFRFGTEQFKKGEKHPSYGVCLGDSLWWGWFGINIHWVEEGTTLKTGSAGCQTIPKAYWDAVFYKKVVDELKKAEQKKFWYCLVEEVAT